MPTVVVTGAGRGIGRATALRMAGAGWEVVAGVVVGGPVEGVPLSELRQQLGAAAGAATGVPRRP